MITRQYDERRQNENATLDVASDLIECVRHGGSVLTDEEVWTDENIDLLFDRFVLAPDMGGQSFFDKLEQQLDGVPDGAIVLFAETFLLQIVPLLSLKHSTKRNLVENVLALAKGDFSIPDEVDIALQNGVFLGGPGFNFRRYYHLVVLFEFFRYFRAQPEETKEQAVSDPWTWKRLVSESPGTEEPSLRNSLLYLGHPDVFLPIASATHKEWIAEVFCPELLERDPTDDVDRDLQEIDQVLAEQLGHLPDYYREPLVSSWRYEEEDDLAEDAEQTEDTADPDVYSVASIVAEGGFHPQDDLEKIVELWNSEKNVILQGAPGTGKTWLARRLAFALIGSKENEAIRVMQFHPGTSYEDFIRGWRPSADGRLQLKDGPLLQHADRARKHPDTPHTLIVEEINRGNPAQAFGEFLTLIEATKRDREEAIELTYMNEGEKPFSLPENFYIIGTMNVADRSLALVDLAFRRRFAFFTLRPQLGDTWLEYLRERFPNDDDTTLTTIRDRVLTLNDIISDDPTLGPDFVVGHSYVTPGKNPSSARDWFRAAVDSKIAPLLTEYWHDDQDHVSDLTQALTRGF